MMQRFSYYINNFNFARVAYFKTILSDAMLQP